MTVTLLSAWLLSVMLATAPPGRTRWPAAAREPAAAGKARYASIARSLAKVTLDPAERPLFTGPQARERTAALLLAISWHESSWRRDVDLGLGRHARGGGRYWCMMQIAVDRGRTIEGWSGPDLVASRERCFRRALHLLRRGQRVCRAQGGSAYLNHYASGHCDRGRRAVATRLRTFHRWLRRRPFEAVGRRPPH